MPFAHASPLDRARMDEVREMTGEAFVEVIDASRRANLSMQTEDFMEKIHSFPYGRVVKQLRFVAGRKGN